MRKRTFDLAAESDLERPQVRERTGPGGFNLVARALVKTMEMLLGKFATVCEF
jgi:hypothetical protein